MRAMLKWVLSCLMLAQSVAAQTPQPAATFDTAWSIIRNTYFDTTFNGVNWDQVRVELRPKAEAAQTNEQLRQVLRDLVGRLGQSHFSLIPQEMSAGDVAGGGSGDVGFDVRYLDQAVVVTRVDEGGPAQEAGVRTGWVLRRLNGDPVEKAIERAERSRGRYSLNAAIPLVIEAMLHDSVGSTAELEFLDARDQPVRVKIKRRLEPGQQVKLGNLPPFFTRFAARSLNHQQQPVGVFWFNVWMLPVMAQLDSAVDRMRNHAGIVLDLRGNPGGAGAMSMGVAGHFVDTAQAFGTMTTRSGTLHFRVNPRRVNIAGQRVKPFDGPVAVLMDELSGSTSEVFAGGLQSLGRVRVFGATSMGAVLPARADRLPNGDILYHAIADFKTADGTLLEGRGVIPDEQVATTRAALLAGQDPVLTAALRWIAAQARAR